MKKAMRIAAICLCVCILLSSTASAGIFPTLKKMKSANQIIHLVSYAEFKGVNPYATENLEDGSRMAVYQGVTEDDYYAFGDFLEENGWTVPEESIIPTENGYEMKIVKGSDSISISYDAELLELTMIYPDGYWSNSATMKVGDMIQFGHYHQTAAGNDNTSIDWQILDIQDSKALLISRYGLDAKTYNTEYADVTWKTCSLRSWLNTEFLNTAFTAAEQEYIELIYVDNSREQGFNEWDTTGGSDTQDKIFLLSYTEANQYLDVSNWSYDNIEARVQPTAYALSQGAYASDECETAEGQDAGYWWLRSPGIEQDEAAGVSPDGCLDTCGVGRQGENGSIRPALWVSLETLESVN